MERIILKLIVNALAILGVVLGIWFLVNAGNNGDNNNGTTIIGKGPVLEAVKQVNKQIFVEHYSMIDVEHSQVPVNWLPFVKQEMVVLLRGRIPAGFDLQKLTEDDIWISPDGKNIQLTLPPPEVFEENVSIDFENSRILSVSDTCPNFICENSLEQYQSEVLPAGRDMLIEFALQKGILQQSVDDGRKYYEQLLKSLDFEEIRVVVIGYGL
jgi:hypothetical protein